MNTRKELDVNFLTDAAKQIWKDNFPGKPFPQNTSIQQGCDHQVILLGDTTRWKYMFRFGITRDISVKEELLNYLNTQNPPVTLVRNIKQISTELAAPYDRFLFQKPVNGEVLYEFLSHANTTEQETIGRSLGQFVKWVSKLSPNRFHKVDVFQQDFHKRKDINSQKLIRCGLSNKQADNLLTEVSSTFQAQTSMVPCFGDLYPPHVFIDSDTTTGIIDWGDSTIGEPIRDFRFWYEPFETTIYKDLYPTAFRAACNAFREGFPTPEDEKRIKLYALVGALDNTEDRTKEVATWISSYGKDFHFLKQ